MPAISWVSTRTLKAGAAASVHACVSDVLNPHARAWAHPRLGVDFSGGHGPIRSIRSESVHPVSLLYALCPPRPAAAAGGGEGSHMKVYAMVINATDACTLHVHYIVHILHNTLLPVGCLLTQRGIIAITIRVRTDRPSTLSAYRSAVYSQD